MEMDRDATCVFNENLLSIRIGEDSNLRQTSAYYLVSNQTPFTAWIPIHGLKRCSKEKTRRGTKNLGSVQDHEFSVELDGISLL